MISILHPSRGRPQRAYETARKWLDNAGCDCEYLLSIDKDDPLLDDYYKRFNINELWTNTGIIFVNQNRSAIDAINNAAKVSTGDIFLVLSDDFDCPPLWGKKILDVVHGKTDWILKTPDGIQEWIITMPIMDRIYYNRFGYIYYPEFRHMFCDTFLTCVADLTRRKIEANIDFKHNHYSIGGIKDEVSIRADATWQQGEKLFIELARQNFLLKPEEVKGQITNSNYLNWIKARL